MEALGINILSFFILMFAVIGFHEYGHFITARILNVKVLQFSIGFGPKVWSWVSKKTNIEYKLSLLPLGGYVKMLDESDDDSKKFSEKDLVRAFNRAPIWKRFLIVFNGPFFNLIMALVIFTGLNMTGKTIEKPIIGHVSGFAIEQGFKENDTILSINDKKITGWNDGTVEIITNFGSNSVNIELLNNNKIRKIQIDLSSLELKREDRNILKKIGVIAKQRLYGNSVSKVREESPADKSGIKAGDKIVRINDIDIKYFHELREIVSKKPGQSINVFLERSGENISVPIVLGGDYNKPYSEKNIGSIGIYPSAEGLKKEWFITKEMNLLEAFNESTIDVYNMTETTLKFLGKMITGDISPKTLSGPVGIAEIAGDSMSSGILQFLSVMGFISVNLMIMNLLPIPVLDGGHLFLYAVESVTGPINEKVIGVLQFIGGLLLFILMAFVITLDVFSLF